MNIKNAKNIDPWQEYLKILVVGDFGTGKSTFFSSFPTDEKPGFIFDFDQHIEGYRGENWDYVQYTGKDNWNTFTRDFNEVKKAILAGKYGTVIIDSTTSMIDLAMERALVLDPERHHGGPVWNIHYQIVKNLIQPKLRGILTFPCNVLVSAHLKLTVDSKTGSILKIDPLLTGDLAEKIPGCYFKEIYYATSKVVKGEAKFKLQTVTKGLFKARSLLSGKERILPDYIPNTYEALINSYKEGIKNVSI